MSDGSPPPPPPDPTRPLPPAAPGEWAAPPPPPPAWGSGSQSGPPDYGYGAPNKPPPAYSPAPPMPYGYQDPRKSKIAAGLLAFFVGAFGVHNFYLGYTGKAVAQLLITVLTCGLGAIITSIWAIVEGVMILTGSIATDANGIPLKD